MARNCGETVECLTSLIENGNYIGLEIVFRK